MKKVKKLVITLVIISVFSLLYIPAGAAGKTDAAKPSRAQRVNKIFTEKIREMEKDDAALHPLEGKRLKIRAIKDLSDFDKNEYTLVECKPTGYFIFHNESGNFVEYSTRSVSPYRGKEDDLYYNGPGQYSYYKKQRPVHAITGQEISAAEIRLFRKESDKMEDLLMENTNENILDYVDGAAPLQTDDKTTLDMTGGANNQSAVKAQGVSYRNMECVSNYKFFTNLQACGVNVNGTCGYVAAGILLSYWQVKRGGNYVSPSYLSYTAGNGVKKYSISNSLHTSLVKIGKDLGKGNGTHGNDIYDVVKKYMSGRGVSCSFRWAFFPIANNVVIANDIYNNRPVIWFGNIASNTYENRKNLAHAIIVYGYSFGLLSGYSYLAHFGWKGANEVFFSGLLGSTFTIA